MTEPNTPDNLPAAPAAPETPAVSAAPIASAATPDAPASTPAIATPAPRRWLKAVAWTGGGLVALTVGAAGGLLWWAGTEGSLATALSWAAKTQPLSAQNVTGSLLAGGHIGQLQWQQPGLKVLVRDATLAWQPRQLLHSALQIDRLSAASVSVHDTRPPEPKSKPSAPPTAISLPVRVTLEDFSVGEVALKGNSQFSASGIAGRYAFNGTQHQFDLKSAHVASGTYRAHATLGASAPLKLDATVSGALDVNLPSRAAPVPLSFEATASGPLTDLAVKANMQMTAAPAAGAASGSASGSKAVSAKATASEKTAQAPHANVSARVMAWAEQPLPQADADFHNLDTAALWPQAPQTLLTGSAKVRPAAHSAAAQAETGTAAKSKSKPKAQAKSEPAWLLDLQLANALPGPWDQQRLPLERLDTQGEWRNGTALIRSLKARIGGGELIASGDWGAPAPAPAKPQASSPSPSPSSSSGKGSNPAPAQPAPAWALKATLTQINPDQLHTKLGPLLLDGRAEVSSQHGTVQFDASLQAAGSGAGTGTGTGNTSTGTNSTSTAPATATANTSVSVSATATANKLLTQLRLRDASVTGSWNPQQAGGTLVLSALQVRTAEAELSGQLEAQPEAKGGQGKLAFSAPGVEVSVNGELRETSGSGEFNLHGRNAAQILRWLQKLPGMPVAVQSASASGSAELQAKWQGGWQDPALDVRLDAPSLDWQPGVSKATTPASPAPIKVRALIATLSGRLSQAQLATQGRVEMGQRRLSLQLAASGGQLKPAGTAPAQAAWQGLVEKLSVSVEDPALGSGAWQVATRASLPLKWTPTSAGGSFESGAGEAVLTAPPGKTAAAASQATLVWQPVRWRPGELVTAGKLTGLPVGWIEMFAGPELASAGLGGTLVFDAEWDAVLSNTLKLKASVARSSGDVTLQADGAPGSARVTAGIKQARISLENVGDALTLGLLWDSERAGTADGQFKTRLSHTTGAQGEDSWLWPVDAPLSGQLRAHLPRIGVWSLLAPPGWRLRGSLGVDVAVSGTRAAPNLGGTLQANDLALRSVVDGIEFGNGRLRASLDGTRMRISEFSLQGAGDKGTGGSLSAQGEAGLIDGQMQAKLDAKLQHLRASIRSDRQLTVSGDVQAKLLGELADITGKLTVDQARIVLPDESTPRLGDDVIVRSPESTTVGQTVLQASPTSAAPADTAPRPVKLAVQLDLGRDFHVKGKGIDTLMRGTLALTGTSLAEPRLNGSIRTSGGQFQAYGQRLDVERGVLRFSGPIDTPALDILAIRPNLTQRVGVQVTGTALLPSVRLYAEPELPDGEKLSWLIVGRASGSDGAEAAILQQAALALLGSKAGASGGLASAIGLDEVSYRSGSNSAEGGAVTVGKRFSRNFYAAYERSLSGAMGTLYVFYDLSRRFTVRAQAGQQSAVDLIFTIPYD